MKVGDKVRLKAGSDRRGMLPDDPDAFGRVEEVAVKERLVWVHFPSLKVYAIAWPMGEFDLIESALAEVLRA